ncbi:hypothetical protein HK405_012500, partial [Cladochytrium tenue]
MHAVVKSILEVRSPAAGTSTFFSITETWMECTVLADAEAVEEDFLGTLGAHSWLRVVDDRFRALQIDSDLGL